MKRKDIFLIGTIVLITGIITFFIGNAVFAPPKDRKEKVEVVESITPEFQKPDNKYFNSASIDPTQSITIGDNNNPQPFTNSTNGR